MSATVPVSDCEGSKPHYKRRVRFVNELKTTPHIVVGVVC